MILDVIKKKVEFVERCLLRTCIREVPILVMDSETLLCRNISCCSFLKYLQIMETTIVSSKIMRLYLMCDNGSQIRFADMDIFSYLET